LTSSKIYKILPRIAGVILYMPDFGQVVIYGALLIALVAAWVVLGLFVISHANSHARKVIGEYPKAELERLRREGH
jgi:hypothetical protein